MPQAEHPIPACVDGHAILGEERHETGKCLVVHVKLDFFVGQVNDAGQHIHHDNLRRVDEVADLSVLEYGKKF